ncbi:MAG TPA: transposase [Burkholderiaceae bacterium]|nr:transposase [Burkholderiaceae bacterium]
MPKPATRSSPGCPSAAPRNRPVIRQAAQAPLLHNDDTAARVLSLMAERKKAEAAGKATPKAINTTGIVALLDQWRVVLFFTGHSHAGQNLETVLAHRAKELAPPMQMCDALASNMAGDFVTVLCHCLAHGRRHVVDVLEHFPQQGRHVLEVLGRVHANPIMKELKTWMAEALLLHGVAQ